jgi:hypothetical protein
MGRTHLARIQPHLIYINACDTSSGITEREKRWNVSESPSLTFDDDPRQDGTPCGGCVALRCVALLRVALGCVAVPES